MLCLFTHQCSGLEVLLPIRHSGLDPESSVFELDSRFPGNDSRRD
jgi:hypothetical protein